MKYFKNRKQTIFIVSSIIIIFCIMFEKIEAVFSIMLMLLFCISFIFVFVSLFSTRLKKIIISKTKLFTAGAIMICFVICVLISMIVWIWLSYYSYYDGLRSSVLQDNKFFIEEAEKIFNNKNRSFEEQINQYKLLTEVSISKITITNLDSNIEYTIKPPVFRQDGNQFTLEPDNKNSKTIDSDFGRLKFEFSSSVAPKMWIGVFRAMTCSLSDIMFTGGSLYNYLNFKNKLKQWSYDYFITENHKRSKNFYRSLFISLVLYFVILGLNKKQEYLNKILSYKNEKLINTNKKLEEFKTIHSKMYSDLLNETNNLKQDMQEFTFSWDSYMEEAFKTERHDLKNIRDAKFQEFLNTISKEEHKILAQYIYDKYVNIMIEKIIKNMKKLPNIVKYDLERVKVSEVLKSIKNGIPEYKDFKIILNENKFKYTEDEKCNINIHRLSSIIFNICANAKSATARQGDEFGKKGKRNLYIPYICIDIEKTFIDGSQYIKVSIKDNAGGFKPEDLNKIYKEPVESTKKYLDQKERKGEGTIYVAFFAKYMNCKIKPYNYKLSEKNIVKTGAAVDVLIPILNNKKEDIN